MILRNLSWFPRALGTAEITLPGEILFESAQEAMVSQGPCPHVDPLGPHRS